MSTASDTAKATSSAYVPPKVWTWQEDAGSNAFASINRPTAGPREEKTLPKGQHPLQLYSMATPNGVKVTVLLEELLAAGVTGAEYDAWLISIGKGDQFGSDFVKINPNSKIPALLDYAPASSSSSPVRLFESGSILLYLADKFRGQHPFLPDELRPEVLNWLFWQMGAAPYLGGGFGHFYQYATEKLEYPINRFTMEAKRQLDVLNRQLAEHEYIAGQVYTIADMAIHPWYGALVLGQLYSDSATFLNVQEEYPHVIRWAQQVAQRPAVQRGRLVNRVWGEEGQLAERHSAVDLDAVLAATTESQK